MKYLKITLLFFAVIFLTACKEPGTTRWVLNGDEINLPVELKGLKVYFVSTGGGNGIYVALKENTTSTSLRYTEGKTSKNVIILENNKSNKSLKEVVFENDSIIVLKK